MQSMHARTEPTRETTARLNDGDATERGLN
jgi:hypothetical protein